MAKQLDITTDIFTDSEDRKESHSAESRGPLPKDIPLNSADHSWVEEQLNQLSPSQCAGMMVASHHHDRAEQLIEEHDVSNFILLGNDLRSTDITGRIRELRQFSAQPLMFSINGEAGLGARVFDATTFTYQMGVAAANNLEATREWGRITAREARALDIDLLLAPTVDVNTEPENPVVATRSASDNPELVSTIAAAYIEGLHEAGCLANLKHFPGHGASVADSHKALPEIDVDVDELDAIHLEPFRRLISMGLADSVMTAHLFFPKVMGNNAMPATLNEGILSGILRKKLGYRGPILSDAFNMAGLFEYAESEEERAVLAIEAGCDQVMAPLDTAAAHRGILRAIESGRLTEARIAASVRRLLEMVSRCRHLQGVEREAAKILNHPSHQVLADSLSRDSVTIDFVKNGVLPLDKFRPLEVFFLQPNSKIFYRFGHHHMKAELEKNFSKVSCYNVLLEGDSLDAVNAISSTEGATQRLVVSYDWTRKPTEEQQRILNQVSNNSILINFGAPYLRNSYRDLAGHLVGFSSLPAVQRHMVKVLLNPEEAKGRLPVCLDCE